MPTVGWATDKPLRLVVAGQALEANCIGPAPDQALTIILLHEGLGCVALWRDFPAHLAEATGCGVFVYSRSGYGGSDPVDLPRPLDYMSQEALQSVPEILDALAIRRCVLLGHSDGASIAAIYTGSVQDFRIRGQILIAPHFFTEALARASIAEAKVAYQRNGLRRKLQRYHKNVDNAFYGWCDAWLDSSFARWDITDVIDFWRIPVMVLQGEQDQYGTTAQLHEMQARCQSPLEINVLANCRHSPHLEQPEQALALMADFIHHLY